MQVLRTLPLALLLALGSVQSFADEAKPVQVQPAKGPLAKGEYQLTAKPSEMLGWSPQQLKPLADQLDADIRAELDDNSVSTRVGVQQRFSWLSLLAQLRGDWSGVKAYGERARRLQESKAGSLTAGVINELLVEEIAHRRGAAWLRKATRERFAAMPWDEIEGVVKASAKALAAMDAIDIVMAFEKRVDPQVEFSGGRVSAGLAMQIIGARVQMMHGLPMKKVLAEGLNDVIALHPDKPAT